MELLDALRKGETKDQIKKYFPGSTYAFTIDFLKKEGLVIENAREISLTEIGNVYVNIFEHAKESIYTYQELLNFFNDHVIYLPEDFFIRLHEIKGFEPVASEPSDILKPHRVFSEYLQKSSEIYGVSPLLFPDYPQLFSGMIEEGRKITLVITDEVYKIISEYPLNEFKNLEIYLIETPPQVAVTVSDKFLSIGYFYKSGSYDFTRDLIATSPSALSFGRNLVEHYKAQSRKIVYRV
jgi:predicted transcriptional regulator